MSVLKLPEFMVPSSVQEAREIQDRLRPQLPLRNDFPDIKIIAGVDVGYDNVRNLAHASIAIIQVDTLTMLEGVQAFAPTEFPYVPGFLSFREIPAILVALAQLTIKPDLLMVDGQGIAHPRRLGIAAHLGALLNIPSIGVGKSCLVGNFVEPASVKGSTSPLIHGTEQIGTVLRSREKVKPLFISPGHRVDIETSVQFTLQCLTRYRLPEPTRLADKFSKVKQPSFPIGEKAMC